jgi:hypothetical protein
MHQIKALEPSAPGLFFACSSASEEVLKMAHPRLQKGLQNGPQMCYT